MVKIQFSDGTIRSYSSPDEALGNLILRGFRDDDGSGLFKCKATGQRAWRIQEDAP